MVIGDNQVIEHELGIIECCDTIEVAKNTLFYETVRQATPSLSSHFVRSRDFTHAAYGA